MSVRIYQLSKATGLDNNAMIELLKERGFDVKSASSTIDNISAESIKEEFAKKAAAAQAEAAPEAVPETPQQPVAPPSLSSFVRSKADVEKEKQEKEEKAKASKAPPPPSPAASTPAAAAKGPPPPAGPAPVAPPPRGAPTSPAPAGPPKATPVAAPAPAAPPATSAPGVIAPPPAPARIGSPPAAAAVGSVAVKESPAASTEEAGDIKSITLKPPIVVRDLATALGLKPFKLISELMEMGIFASMNQSLEEEVACDVAEKHGVILEIRHRGEGAKAKKKQKVLTPEDEEALLEERPAAVCILGHVDHGKTTLLDSIRKSNVVSDEAGGITQHIGAYQIDHGKKRITFLDTPGHAAFNKMRARGADVTDIAVLVVAADDGFKPQTDEALKFLQKSGVQPIVAINKIDAPGANIDRVKSQMQERGIASEDWGGQVICVELSALKGEGISDLLDMILLQAEVLELKANPQKPATGVVIETQMEVGRGATATIIIQGGTLKVGDALVCGQAFTKVKAIFNDLGEKIKTAPPSTPVKVIGWSHTLECGAIFKTVKNEKEAKREAEENIVVARGEAQTEAEGKLANSREMLFEVIAGKQKKTLRVILKGDVYGSVEAVVTALEALDSEKVALEVVSSGVGAVSKSDVQRAAAGDTIVIGFNVKNENGVQALAKHHQVQIVFHQIIYELIDQVRDEMASMLDPEFRENKIGAAEIRAVFPIAKGQVAGCLVVEGRVEAKGHARVIRKEQVVHESKIDSLRRVKDEVKEVRAGTECGIHLSNFNDYQVGDVIEVFEIHEIRPEL